MNFKSLSKDNGWSKIQALSAYLKVKSPNDNTYLDLRLSNDDNDTTSKDRLLRDYDTVLKESAILTSFGGILFGFLLNISV
jgi:hypothetical protein